MNFYKYHALGNDYLVVHPTDLAQAPEQGLIRRMCERHTGAGSDGLLYGPLQVNDTEMQPGAALAFGLRIFNPDGSEAEKSGNGLRIFARFLWDRGLLQADPDTPGASRPFYVHTAGGIVSIVVQDHGGLAQVEMGRASFDSRRIPVLGPERQVVDEPLQVGGETLRICAVTMGNPHCVVLNRPADEATARRLGPLIEVEACFPRRTNVQFMEVLDRHNLRIAIWERGAGYTLASGSSSCAAAAAAHRLGLTDPQMTVHNPGGQIQIHIAANGLIRMTGPVARVYAGRWEAD
ncbi:MAG: diaminopimelate epimerase [Chloroflexota bacterium]